jgi:ribosomal peptide maturation radical SAM protein 1
MHATPPAPSDGVACGRREWPTILVTMPFMDATRPSIQLGLLKEIATAHGFPVRTLHANLDLAARLGPGLYGLLSEQRGALVGDWLFSVEAFGPAAPDHDAEFLRRCDGELACFGGSPDDARERLLRVRDRDIPAYLDALVAAWPWEESRVVAFSCTFQQNTASFALARRLKGRDPGIVTVFGGANFDGPMGLELVRAVDCIDVAVLGEGDLAFPGVLGALAAGTDVGAVPGVAVRDDAGVRAASPPPPLRTLDDLPVPDYGEYFERAEDLGLQPRTAHRSVFLPFEAARGCWWGAKHHCTFCGLNGTTLEFRAKSPGRVLAELALQARRYRSFAFEAVDNILDPAYLRELFPAIVASRADYTLFYEVKANLTRQQLGLLARAGVTRIQPGVESLSSHVLALMRKGVRAAQNVNLLRWAHHYDVAVEWNLLWGFPGETELDYAEQAAVVPHLVHLPPPSGAGRIWMERFSPLFTEPDTSGVRSRTPERSYRYIYPAGVDLEKVAYFFDYELADPLPDGAYTALSAAVAQWSAAWTSGTPPVLTYWSAPGFVQLYDARHPGSEGTYTFEGTVARIYLACTERPVGAAAVRDRLGLDWHVEEVEEVFGEFARRGLMFRDGPLAVALGLPAVTRR